jgi:hypothetical protein
MRKERRGTALAIVAFIDKNVSHLHMTAVMIKRLDEILQSRIDTAR